MTNRIAVPAFALLLLATPALAVESPKPSPAVSPAKAVGATPPLIVASPKPTATPVKHAAVNKPSKVASAKTRHPHRSQHADPAKATEVAPAPTK